MTRITDVGRMSFNWNEHAVRISVRNYWRASLVPAAAVIPAPEVYINTAVVKMLVVGYLYAMGINQ